MTDIGGSFTWYGHSCVELLTPGGKTLMFDPWFGNPTSPRAAADVKQCDLMLVTRPLRPHRLEPARRCQRRCVDHCPRDQAGVGVHPRTVAVARDAAWRR